VVTFYLRKGVKWHMEALHGSGRQEHYGLMAKPPAGKVWFGGPLKDVTEKVEAVDDYTVKVTLRRRSFTYFTFLAAGSIGTVVPKHILDAQKGVMRTPWWGQGPSNSKVRGRNSLRG